MSKNPFENSFDPYDALIELNERMNRLEVTHNKLAHAYQRTEQELNIALQSLNSLQKGHLALSRVVHLNSVRDMDIRDGKLKP
jgi:hypothetical protein